MLSLSFLVSCDDKAVPEPAPAADDAWKQTEYISITSTEELMRIPELPDKKFILVEDLDLSSEGTWTPLCSIEEPFTGEFDGNGHVLTGLTVSGSGITSLGLFAAIENAAVKDLTLENVSLGYSGASGLPVYAGPVAGCAFHSVISGCRASGSVSVSSSGAGELCTGGLVGVADGVTLISDSASSADIYSMTENSVSFTGGIAGMLSPSAPREQLTALEDPELLWGNSGQPADIRDSFSFCSIQNSLFNGTIRCHAAQPETGATSYCGGICGDGKNGRVTGCAVLARSIRFEGTQIPVYSPLSNLSFADNCAILEELDADAYEFADELIGQDTFHAAADAARLASGLMEDALGVDLGISQYIPKYISEADAGKASTYTDLGWDLENTWKMASGAPVPYAEQKPKILPGWYSYEKDSLQFRNYSDKSPKGDVISRVFENASAEVIAKYNAEGTGGYCYGMCMSTAGILNDMPEIGRVYSPDHESAGWVPSHDICDVQNPTADRSNNELKENDPKNPNHYPSYIKFGNNAFDIHDYIETVQFIQSSADIAADFQSTTQRTDLLLERVRDALEHDEVRVPIAILYPSFDKEKQETTAGGHIFLAVGLSGNDILVDDSNLDTLSRFTITENGGWKYYLGLTDEDPWHTSEDAIVQTSSDISKGYLFFMNSYRKVQADNDYAMDETPPDDRFLFDPDDPNAGNPELPIAADLRLSEKLGASDILVHSVNGRITSDGGPVIPLGPSFAVKTSETEDPASFNMNPSGLYWATDAGTVTVSDFDTAASTSGAENDAFGNSGNSLNSVEIAADNTCIRVRAADDASVTATIFEETVNTVIDTAAGNPAEITVTTYADNAAPKVLRLSGTSSDGSIRIAQTEDGTLRAAGMKDIKASAATMETAAADGSEMPYDEQDALLEKLLSEQETSVPDSAPDKAADITMDPDGNGVTAKTDVPLPEIRHPEVPQNKDRSIYGASVGDGTCPLCGKVHGDSITERLTEKLHTFIYNMLRPVIGPLNSKGTGLPKLPAFPGGNKRPGKWLESSDLTGRLRELLKR